ncbi:MAG: FMN-binding protein [Planctomycetales bacterium]|nr:FMN-binding protein [Planctomycetales bacterium]
MSNSEKQNPILFFLRESWLLMVSAVFFGGLLALTDAAWSPKVKQNATGKFADSAQNILAAAKTFEPLAEPLMLTVAKGKQAAADVRKGLDDSGACVGWVFVAEGSGFADKIKLVVAVDAAFETMYGFSVLACSETPGFGDKITITDENSYQAQYRGAPVGEFTLVKVGDNKKIDNEIIAITGATVTSRAVVDIMNAYAVPLKEQLAQKGLLQ